MEHKKLYSIDGKKLKIGFIITSEGLNNYQIDVSNLPDGLYVIEITIGNKKVCKKLLMAW